MKVSKIKFLLCSVFLASVAFAETFEGTIEAPVCALGSETTGIVLQMQGGRADLSVPMSFRTIFEGMNGMNIMVEGNLTEIPYVYPNGLMRKIITVEKLVIPQE